MRKCTYPGCDRQHKAKGLCNPHYLRSIRKAASMLLPPPMTDEERFWSKVRKTDTCWLWTGKPNGAGYGRFCYDYKIVRAHRYSYELAAGPIPEGMEIDHQCHVELCVNPDHLLLCDRQVNTENRKGAQSNNRGSGIRGVYRGKKGRWEAKFKSGGKAVYVGTFDRIEDAEAAVIAARLKAMTNSDLEIRNRSKEAA